MTSNEPLPGDTSLQRIEKAVAECASEPTEDKGWAVSRAAVLAFHCFYADVLESERINEPMPADSVDTFAISLAQCMAALEKVEGEKVHAMRDNVQRQLAKLAAYKNGGSDAIDEFIRADMESIRKKEKEKNA